MSKTRFKLFQETPRRLQIIKNDEYEDIISNVRLENTKLRRIIKDIRDITNQLHHDNIIVGNIILGKK